MRITAAAVAAAAVEVKLAHKHAAFSIAAGDCEFVLSTVVLSQTVARDRQVYRDATTTMGDVATTVIVSGGDRNGNVSNGSTPDDTLSTVEVVSYSVALSALIAATIFGNILVVLSVFTYAPLKTIPNFFVASLACADLAVAVLVMPFNVANFVQGRWSFGAVWCNAWLTFDILTCTASILHLCAIALDRYNAIHDPITYAMQRTRHRVLVKLSLIHI